MLKEYLNPVRFPSKYARDTIGRTIDRYIHRLPSRADTDVAIIGIPGDGETNTGSPVSDKVRHELYQLNYRWPGVTISDFGNLSPDLSTSSLHHRLTTVLQHLLEHNIMTIIIGGTHDFTNAQYEAYKSPHTYRHLTVVDEKVDWTDDDEASPRHKFLKETLSKNLPPFSLTILGYQSYYLFPQQRNILEEQLVNYYRLGAVRNDLRETEPMIRDTNVLSWDMRALRYAEAPGVMNPTPNGFYADEACQITRYAGLTPRLYSIGFYDLAPQNDMHQITARVTAQMIWYYIEGVAHRHQDDPVEQPETFLKYNVQINNDLEALTFWKSKKSGRWWLESPLQGQKGAEQVPSFFSCTYTDYQRAIQEGEVPARLLKIYKKLNH